MKHVDDGKPDPAQALAQAWRVGDCLLCLAVLIEGKGVEPLFCLKPPGHEVGQPPAAVTNVDGL